MYLITQTWSFIVQISLKIVYPSPRKPAEGKWYLAFKCLYRVHSHLAKLVFHLELRAADSAQHGGPKLIWRSHTLNAQNRERVW